MQHRCDECREASFPCAICREAADLSARAAWDAYCRSGRKPTHVPERPDVVYADAWSGWQEWLTWMGIVAHQPELCSTVAPDLSLPGESDVPVAGDLVPVADALD